MSIPAGKCGVVVNWNNGHESQCLQYLYDPHNDTECYAHKKYFDTIEIGGEKVHQSGPDPRFRKSRFVSDCRTDGKMSYITSVYSPRRGERRAIGYDDED